MAKKADIGYDLTCRKCLTSDWRVEHVDAREFEKVTLRERDCYITCKTCKCEYHLNDSRVANKKPARVVTLQALLGLDDTMLKEVTDGNVLFSPSIKMEEIEEAINELDKMLSVYKTLKGNLENG